MKLWEVIIDAGWRLCRVSAFGSPILSLNLHPYIESNPHKFIGSPRWTLLDIKKRIQKGRYSEMHIGKIKEEEIFQRLNA